jgi:hypothetical protein
MPVQRTKFMLQNSALGARLAGPAWRPHLCQQRESLSVLQIQSIFQEKIRYPHNDQGVCLNWGTDGPWKSKIEERKEVKRERCGRLVTICAA